MQRIEPTQPASSEPLSKRVVRGGIWVFTLRIASRLLGLVRTIILARLLAPKDFGLFGVAILAISALNTFSQTGFEAALVQKKDNVGAYLDTAWTVSAVRAIFLFLILFFSSPLVAAFFNSSQATLVIRIIAVSTILSGCKNIGMIFFQKELEFDKQFIYEFSGTLIDLTVAISLAFILRNVWALVWGGVAANFVRLFMSYIIHPYRPHVRFDKSEFEELFGFGKWVLGSSILIFLIMQGDDIFVGKMMGVSALGLYQMAYLVSNLPATEIAHLISRVTFPAYSKLQDNLPELREAYLKVLQITAFVSIPLAGGIFILAPEFTEIFLGDKWMPMVPAIQALVLAGLVGSIQATTTPIFLAVNRPEIEPRWQAIRLLVLVILIYPFSIRWGICGTSIAVFLSIFISALGFSFMVLQITKGRKQSFLKIIGLPFMNALFMVVILLTLKDSIPSVEIWQFALLIVVGILTYLCIAYLFDRFLNYGIMKIMKEIFAFL